ncbi:hypothetical protein D3C72_2051540 [compost metagenome]
MEVACQTQQRNCQRGPTALAQPQTEVEQRFSVQGFQYMPMTRLGAAMTEQQPWATLRVQAHRDQRRDAANEAVHQHRDSFLGTSQISAHQRGNLKTAQIEQRLQRITPLCPVYR